jgi:hypothetical protein
MSAAAAIATPPKPASLFERLVPVGIYQLAREFELWLWLCPLCLARRLAAGWAMRVRKLPPPSALLVFLGPAAYCDAAMTDRTILTCDDCRTATPN